MATIVSLNKSLCAPVNSNSTVTSSHLSRKQKNASVKLSANITFDLPKWFFREKNSLFLIITVDDAQELASIGTKPNLNVDYITPATQRRKPIIAGEQSYLHNFRRHYTTANGILQSFSFYGDKGFCYLNLAGITKLNYDRKNECIRVVISKRDTIRILPIDKHIITLPVFPYRSPEKYNKF